MDGDSLNEGEVGTFRALFSRPVAFDPYIATPIFGSTYKTNPGQNPV